MFVEYLNEYVSGNTVATLVIFLTTFLLLFYNTRRERGIPPGPVLLPVIGNLFSLAGGNIFKNLDGLRSKYGDIYSLYIGNELTIFLNGFEVINDALVKKASLFSVRPYSYYTKLTVKCPGIIYCNDKLWKEQRQFSQKALQEICFRKSGSRLEHYMQIEIDSLVNWIEQFDEPFDIGPFIHVGVANVIASVIFNKRFSYEDKGILNFIEGITENTKHVMKGQVLVNCFPFLYRCPGDLVNVEIIHTVHAKCLDFLRKHIDVTSKVELENEDVCSFVQMFKEKIKESEDHNEQNTFNETQLFNTCFDIAGAGIETSSTTIRWLILYLLRNPDVQEKMFQEINEKIGRHRKPTLEDRRQLVYVQAVVHEGLRIEPVAPLSIPHSVSRDTVFHGHLLPENSTVMVNLQSVLKDPNIWEDPEEFRPERFLNEEQTELVIPKAFFPFSLGPRSCLGETLARIEIFMFITALVQHFRLQPAVTNELPDTEGTLGLTWAPSNFLIRAIKR